MALPGSFAGMVPAGEDHLVRRIADLERALRELGPSIAASFKPVILDLQAKQAELEDLVSRQIEIDSDNDSVTGFDLTTSYVAQATLSIPVPAGFSRADIITISHAGALNDTASTDFLHVETDIAGLSGIGLAERVPAGNYGTAHSSHRRRFTGLSGGALNIDLRVRSNIAGWSYSGSNQATVDAFVIFRR